VLFFNAEYLVNC